MHAAMLLINEMLGDARRLKLSVGYHACASHFRTLSSSLRTIKSWSSNVTLTLLLITH